MSQNGNAMRMCGGKEPIVTSEALRGKLAALGTQVARIHSFGIHVSDKHEMAVGLMLLKQTRNAACLNASL